MTRWSVPALAIALAAAGLAALGVSQRIDRSLPARPAAARPTLALLTSLPLVFGESFGLESGGSAALTRLEQRYNVLPIGVADAASLEGQSLLLMAHARAQPAEALVELDRWVRGGGRVLLLADPRLDWHSERPLGDRLRPPPAFADTGLLAHWGLKLSGPAQPGPEARDVGKYDVLTLSPGRLRGATQCEISAKGLIARCPIGQGAATVVADADFLNVEEGVARDSDAGRNLELVIDELAKLEGPRDFTSP